MKYYLESAAESTDSVGLLNLISFVSSTSRSTWRGPKLENILFEVVRMSEMELIFSLGQNVEMTSIVTFKICSSGFQIRFCRPRVELRKYCQC